MAHLPSPASASSSTLIVTPLPSKESQESIQFDDLPPSESELALPPHSAPRPKPKPRPHPLTINTAPMSNVSPPTANEPKMSSKGFVEPHHGHLPRRTKTKAKERAKSVSVVAGATQKPPDLNRGISDHSAAAVSSTSHAISTSATTKPSSPAHQPPTLASFASSQTPTFQSSSSPPSHPFIPRHELAPPIHLTSLRLPPSPPPPPPPPIRSLPLSSAALATAGGAGGVASPAFATPGGSATPNLPRRKVSKRRKQSGVGLRNVNVDIVEGAENNDRVVSFENHSGGSGGGGGVRHVREGAEDAFDNIGSTSSQSSASRARARSPTPAPRGTSGDAGAAGARQRARSSSRPRLAFDEGASYATPTSARLLVGKRARGVSLPRLRLGESPLRTSFTGAHQPKEEKEEVTMDPFTSAKGKAQGKETRKMKKVDDKMCLQQVGRDSGVEVGFLDEDEDGEDFWGLRARDREGEEEGEKQRGVRRVVLRVVDDSTDLRSTSTVRTPTTSTSHDVFDAELPFTPTKGTSSPEDVPQQYSSSSAEERQELELLLPDDLLSYRDGETILTDEQLREGCEFIRRHLSTTKTEERQKKKIRVLSPRARPEEAMSLALCYLAYLRDSPFSDSLLSSLRKYFRDSPDEHVHVDDETEWYRTLSPAHLLYMRLLDEGDGEGPADPRGRETSRRFDGEVDVDVVGERESAGAVQDEYAGVRTEWRGVLSFDGLCRVDEAGAGAGRGRDGWGA